jgi:APA family basic amino acid/polyamine antiporter
MSSLESPPPARHLDLTSGIGLVVSNMIGAGVFLSAGYMAQDLGPGLILLAWGVGAVVAMAGARAYAQVAVWVPRSGGEYRFLSELLHPALGYLAGWASLLVGFSAPIAVNALAAGAFAATLHPGLDPRTVSVIVIVVLTAFHAAGLRASKWTHNTLVAVDALLLLGFVAVGLTLGQGHWPHWSPPNVAPHLPISAFAGSLFYIAFAFSGWNAAVYVASDFRDPRRDVPRSMLIGCGIVAVLYLAVNWVFVANLSPEQGRVVFDYETTRVTLGHVVVRGLLGEAGGVAMSLLTFVALVAAASAMTVVGPRVYAAMAEDGVLPSILRGRAGRPPVSSILLQSALALALVFTHTLQQVLSNAGAILTLFAALVSCAVFRERLRPSGRPRPDGLTMACAALHVASTALMLYFGFGSGSRLRLLLWIAVVALAALAAYGIMRAAGGRTKGQESFQ